MATLVKNSLNICSYNSTGFGLAVQNYIDKLLLFSDILCVQEHFLLDSKDKKHSNTDKIRQLFSDKYDMFIVPAHKDNKGVTKGRGKGGLVTMWGKGLTKYVEKVDCPNYRLQATKFKFPEGHFLLKLLYALRSSIRSI